MNIEHLIVREQLNRYYYKKKRQQESIQKMITDAAVCKMLNKAQDMGALYRHIETKHKRIYHEVIIWILETCVALQNKVSGGTYMPAISNQEKNAIADVVRAHKRCISGEKVSQAHWHHLRTKLKNMSYSWPAYQGLANICRECKLPNDMIYDKLIEILKEKSNA